MGKVRVWNDNTHAFTQKFRGETVKIPSKKYVLMEYDDASTFVGEYYPMELDADGVQDPRSYKMLRIDKASNDEETIASNVLSSLRCNACGYESPNQKDLDTHIMANHAHQILKDEDHVEMKKRGRPRKDAEATA